MRARPAGPAEPSALHYFARSGPTKEAHRRALIRQGCDLRFWELAGDSNPQPAVYKTAADRPAGAGACFLAAHVGWVVQQVRSCGAE
jgi:hypothetical protein